MADETAADVVQLELRDGTPVNVRRVVPADKDNIRSGLERMSAESRYRRFMAPMQRLSDEQLRYLTEVDHVDHLAWGAVDPQQPGQPGVAIARCVRLPEDPQVAEAAIAVVDSHQGQGLGTLMLGVLSRAALACGIRVFRSYVLEANKPMLKILTDLGAEVTSLGDGTAQVDLRIPDDPDELPATPAGKVLRAVAKRMVPPLVVPHPQPLDGAPAPAAPPGCDPLLRAVASEEDGAIHVRTEPPLLAIERVLVPMDASRRSERAMRVAVNLAATCGARVDLFHVFGGQSDEIPAAMMQLDLERRGEVAVHNRFDRGDVAERIVKVAEDGGYDLIVMSTRGASGLAHILRGSVAERVVNRTGCPVLIVPPRRPS